MNIRISLSGEHLGDLCWRVLGMLVRTKYVVRKEDTHIQTHTHAQSALQEEAHCAERRSMEGSGHVRRGKTETSRRLFSASPAPPLSRDTAGQCFAPGYNLSAQGEDTFHSQQQLLSVQKYCANLK